MSRLWKNILHTAIAGTDRQPLPPGVAQQLLVPESADAAQTALYALAASHLIQKAARLLEAQPPALPVPALPDERPLCRPQTAQDLKAMLRGVFPEVLPEFFGWLGQSGRRLPPELLPQVLEHLFRRKQGDAATLASLGPLAQWLALQHPDWADLYPQTQPEWDTGTPAERRNLLTQARHSRPLVGLAWLERTWASERPEHKIQFLHSLRSGLSLADEPLLERAATDAQAPVRYLARRLLLLLPDSRLRQESRALIQQDALAGLDLDECPLPENGAFGRLTLLSLVPALAPHLGKASPEAVWFSLRAPADLGTAPEAFPATVLDTPWLPFLLDSIAWHADVAWADAALRSLEAAPEHPLWRSEVLQLLLQSLPAPERLVRLTHLCRHPALLEAPRSALAAALLAEEQPWPKALLQALLVYPVRAGKHRQWHPEAHLLRLLERAAYRCQPADAEELDLPEGHLPYAWHSQLVQLRSIAGFRRRVLF
ncbi:MAG: hypothetical protein IT260_08960 [Saprospiraceae bacterium]|nr:hypothetical protein [Saprospiraceae bacterium]